MGVALEKNDKKLKSEKKKTHRPFVLAAVMLAMFMAAVEATIVSTAMPAIAADLGGFSLYSWVFSSYLLMNAVTVLIYGKLSDIFGRKPIIIIGISIFLVGSILCGLAVSIEMLILFRFIQGFGAGAVMPIASTIVGDMYTKEERAKIQGYLSSVWGISAVLGPAIGGLLVQFVSWRYVFWINVPLGLLAILVISLYLHEGIEKKKPSIDYKGAFLLFVSISSLMFVLVEGGVHWAWNSMVIITCIFIFAITFLLFIIQETKAVDPMMPFNIWKERPILIANVTSLTTGVMLIGISSFLPAFVQGVMEKPPIIAGFTLTTMSIGWPIAATIAGRILLKVGFRTTSIIGGIALIAGSIIFMTLNPEDGPLWAAFGSFMIGVGMGFSTTAFIVSIQSNVEWKQRGAATAANMFMRTLGSTVGAALLGGILNSKLQKHFQESGMADQLTVDSTTALMDEQSRQQLTDATKMVLQEGLTTSLNTVYFVVSLFAVVSFVLIILLPKKE
ncbi:MULTISPECIES: MDR family MFS transporter [Sutcliffiella]|uniref:MFS transporter n=1 Tax=Sutcliffiella cohnii TaxID=33932 RepID=A0A223KXZ0_9BACI|nr:MULTISPECIES: MDR family MFS transporter [Sutcliffiella]AST94300.1 MFS transporter [Sutcliffiella cohnii]MED4014841.1 MDR family MFS transporter [Sutcliffiella cohnii]WBL17575.1 MDR family MFS transporter [Sutcliffiella sp. NC1]